MKNIAAFLIFISFMGATHASSSLDNWGLVGGDSYEVKIDDTVSYTGSKSVLLYSKDVANPRKGYIFQTLKPCPVEDGMLAVSVHVKTEGVNRVGSVLNVSTAIDYVRYEHSSDEISGSSTWTVIRKIIDIPIDCVSVNVGVYLKGHGKVWADDFKIENVENTTPLSKINYKREFNGPDKIEDSGFEDNL
jgi:AraC family transcriptional regulator